MSTGSSTREGLVTLLVMDDLWWNDYVWLLKTWRITAITELVIHPDWGKAAWERNGIQ
ncbi:hypothetical protein MPER_09598, partial [Moniliophthora perniciosa FA553]